MKAAEARKMIGKVVTWKEGSYPAMEAKILDVRGKNVLVDMFGFTDWKWLPDMIDLKEKPNP